MGGTTVGGDGRHGVLSLRMADLAPFLNVLSVLFKAEFIVQCMSKVFKALHGFNCFIIDQDLSFFLFLHQDGGGYTHTTG